MLKLNKKLMMPLSTPSGGGSGSPFGNIPAAVYGALVENNGSDASIAYEGGMRYRGTNDIYICGDSSYVGQFQNQSVLGRPTQMANLPTAIATVTRMSQNTFDGGLLALGGNVLQRNPSTDGSAAWVTITPPFSNTRFDVTSINGNIYVWTSDVGADLQIEVSEDNGATWDRMTTGIAGEQVRRAIVSPSGAHTFYATTFGHWGQTTDPGTPASPGTFNNFGSVLTNNMQDIAVNDAETIAIAVNDNGNVSFSLSPFTSATRIDAADNIFINTLSGVGVQSVAYSSALEGFILVAASFPLIGFIRESAPSVVVPGAFFGDASFGIANGAGISDVNGDVLFCGSANECYLSLRA